jgi:hypothetical protein
VCEFQHTLRLAAVNALGPQVNQHDVVVRAACSHNHNRHHTDIDARGPVST